MEHPDIRASEPAAAIASAFASYDSITVRPTEAPHLFSSPSVHILVLFIIWGSMISFSRFISAVLANSRIEDTDIPLLSEREESTSSSRLFERRTLPSFSILTTFICWWIISTSADSSPLFILIIICNFAVVSRSDTFIFPAWIYSLINGISEGLTEDNTSSPRSESPASIPAATAVSIPFKPSQLGTTTAFTFLMMLPLASTSIVSAAAFKVFLQSAEA